MLAATATLLMALFAQGTILERERFPDVDVHQLELQRYNMARYFYGSPLSYSLSSASSYLRFRSSQNICMVPSKKRASLSYMLDPLTDDMPQVLLVLYDDFSLAMHQLNDSCKPVTQEVILPAHVDHKLLRPNSLFAYYQSESVFYVIVDVQAKGAEEEPGPHLIVVKWDQNGPQVKGMTPSGELANATMLAYQDMLFLYFRCIDRATCAVPADNAVYGFLLRGGRLVRDMDPYLIAKMDDEFFGGKGMKISDIKAYNDSLLVCDIGNNMIYQVRISTSDRLPSLHRKFSFLPRAESLAVTRNANEFYVAARLSINTNAEVMRVRDNNLDDIYFDYSQRQGSDPLGGQNSYRIASTCVTKNFHFTLLYSARNPAEQYVRAVSFEYKYVDIVPVQDVVLIDCYLSQYDYILAVHRSGYALIKFKFPELVVNYTNIRESELLSVPRTDTFTFVVKSPTSSKSFTRSLTVYPAYGVGPSMRYSPTKLYPLYNYKGMLLSVDLAHAYGGLVNGIGISASPNLTRLVSVEPKWETFTLLNLTKLPKRYGKIVDSARERSLLLSESDGRIYVFPFSPRVISGVQQLVVFCFRVSSTNGEYALVECASEAAAQDSPPLPAVPIVGPIVRVSGLYYAAITRSTAENYYYLDMYQYDSETRRAKTLRKIINDAFSSEDEILSLIYNPLGNPKTIIVYGNRGTRGFYRVFAMQCEPGKLSLRAKGNYTTPNTILKAAFLPDCNVAVFLCRDNARSYLLVRPFVEVQIATNVIPIGENVLDFVAYSNHIIAVTVEGNVFQYTLDYPDLLFVRRIPLPTNAFVVVRDGRALINIDRELTGKSLFIYLLVETPIGSNKLYQVYMFDILDITRNAPYLTVDMKLVNTRTEICDLAITKYKEHSVLLLVTSEFIQPLMFHNHMYLRFDGAHASRALLCLSHLLRASKDQHRLQRGRHLCNSDSKGQRRRDGRLPWETFP